MQGITVQGEDVDHASSGSDEMEGEAEYEVERILYEDLQEDGTSVYLVKWLGYPDEECTWEPATSFLDPHTLEDWKRQLAMDDALDHEGLANLQARMDAFQEAQREKTELEAQEHAAQRSPGHKKRQRESPQSPPSPRPPALKKSRIAPNEVNEANSPDGPVRRKNTQSAPSNQAPSSNPVSNTPQLSIGSAGKSPGSSAASVSQGLDLQLLRKDAAVSRPSERISFAKNPLQPVRSQPDIPAIAKSRPSATDQSAPSKLDRTPFKAGQRFKTLSHQNNYQKMARLEPAPDISKLQLKGVDDWGASAQSTQAWQDIGTRNISMDSPLFLPDDGNGFDASAARQNPGDISAASAKKPKILSAVAKPIIGDSTVGQLGSSLGTKAESFEPVIPDPRRQPPSAGSKAQLTGRSLASNASGTELHPAADHVTPNSVVPLTAKTEERGKSTLATDVAVTSRSYPGTKQGSYSAAATAENGNDVPKDRPPSWSAEQTGKAPDTDAETMEPKAHQSLQRPSFFRVSAPTPVIGPSTFQGLNGRTYKKGEVLVYLHFGSHEVGFVKFTELPLWMNKLIIATKKPLKAMLEVHFQQDYVRSRDEFAVDSNAVSLHSALATMQVDKWQIDKGIHGLGAIEPYEDTINALQGLAEYLENNNVAAIWASPNPHDTAMLILFSMKAADWHYLNLPPFPLSNSRLRLAVVKKLTGFSASHRSQDVRMTSPDRDAAFPPKSPRLRRLSTTARTNAAFQSPIETASSLVSQSRVSERPVQTSKSPRRRNSKPLRAASAGAELTFLADFDGMIAGLDTKAQRRSRFYIAFAKSDPPAAKAVKEWLLSQAVSFRKIFSDVGSEDWEDIRIDMEQKTVMLFSDGYPNYASDFPHFYRYLRTSNFCYTLSFVGKTSDRIGQRNTVTRLFPRGTVLCITEATILRHAEATVQLLKWFEKSSIKKEEFWKLIVPPNLDSWLMACAAKLHASTQARYGDVLAAVQRLQTRSLEINLLKRQRYEDPEQYARDTSFLKQDGLVISPGNTSDYEGNHWEHTTMDEQALQQRDQKFVDYFIGWSTLNAHKYRQFQLADAKHTQQTERNACHIWFRHPNTVSGVEPKTLGDKETTNAFPESYV
jgi:hypothetical protein